MSLKAKDKPASLPKLRRQVEKHHMLFPAEPLSGTITILTKILEEMAFLGPLLESVMRHVEVSST
jgi:hypothetical protein